MPQETALKILALAEEAQEDLMGEAAPPEEHEVMQCFVRARPKNHPERFVVLASFLEETGDRPLRWDEIRDLFEKAEEKPPVNLGRDLRMAIDRGLIEPAGPHLDELEDV